MNKIRISLTQPDTIIKGSIKIEGSTSFVQSCLAEVIVKTAHAYKCSPERVLQDIYHVICKEKEADENSVPQ